MKIIILLSLIICGCETIMPGNYNLPFYNLNKIDETNYMETPCLVDGTIVKKKPKVINVFSNDTN